MPWNFNRPQPIFRGGDTQDSCSDDAVEADASVSNAAAASSSSANANVQSRWGKYFTAKREESSLLLEAARADEQRELEMHQSDDSCDTTIKKRGRPKKIGQSSNASEIE